MLANPPPILNSETMLAIAYVPAARRGAVATLFALDDRLVAIFAATREPALGEMRLLWWRDAIAALDRAPPPAEPLLRAIAAEILPCGVTGAELAAMEEAWAALLGPPADVETLTRHAVARGAAIFRLAARLMGEEASGAFARAGEGWALADVARYLGGEGAATARAMATQRLAPRPHWPPALRPLGMLAILAARDAARPEKRRPGSPARIARMMAHRLTGR